MGAEHKCLLEKAKTLTPVANDIVRQLKPKLVDMLKTREFSVPMTIKGLEISPIKIDHFDFKSMAVLNSANRLQLKLTGLHLRVAKVSVKLSRKIVGSLFLQINERAKQRKLFLRNKHSARLAKGGKKKKGGVFKKIGSAVKTVASKIGHAGGLVVHGARSLITNRIKCNGHVWGHLGGTDFQTDIYFSPGPKLAIRDSKVSI